MIGAPAVHGSPPSWRDTVPSEGGRHDARIPGAHAASVTALTLHCVVRALETAEVEHFLLDRSRSGSRVGLAASSLATAWSALRDVGERHPLYVTARSDEVVWRGLARDLPSLGGEAVGDPDQVVVFFAVTEPASGLRLGESQGCSLEVWHEDRGGLVATRATLRTSAVTAEDRASPTRLRVDGLPVTTIPPFDAVDVLDIGFPVDAVVLWVDGSDPEWRARRDRALASKGLPPEAPGSEERLFRDHGELRYLFRSLEQYAPWLRRVHLVTAGQRPPWLRSSHPRLNLVDHDDIIEPSALPVFSPRPITARMHRIDGLSEHFVYFNDDMILARRVEPSLFFTSGGISKFFLSKATVPRGPTDLPHLGARQHMQRLIADRYGVHVSRTFRHAPYALTRRTFELLEQGFGTEIEQTVHRPFRSVSDVTPEWLHHYVAHLEGLALPANIAYGYYPVAQSDRLEEMSALLTNRRLDCFCLNDDGEGDLGADEVDRVLGDLLERLLPLASSFEVDGPGPAPPDEPR